jgi:hypothetical protein
MHHPVDTPRVDHTHETLFQRPDTLPYPLHVITTVFNSPRFRSRWRLYEDFAKMVAEAGAILYTVEIAFGDRAFSVTQPDNPRHVQLRTQHELWLKERAINLGIQRLPPQTHPLEGVAWVDADVSFVRDDWANETLHRLQHYEFVQMWSQFQDLTSEHELVGTAHSFMAGYLSGWEGWERNGPGYYYPVAAAGKKYPGAPGLAWAARRSALSVTGGLLDTCILGSGDWYMAWALVGALDNNQVREGFHPEYRKAIYEWQRRARRLHRNVGLVPGLALHHWHGLKSGRLYRTRDEILVETQFDPTTDIRPDWQGVWQLDVHDDRTIQLRDRVRGYFHGRKEDAL